MKESLRVPLVMVVPLIGAPIANAQQVPDPRLADLVQAGKIRVGLFLPQYIKDPATGEIKGVWVEIALALATCCFCRSTLGPPTSATSRPQFSNSTTPYWCRLAPRPAASPTQTGPGFASRLCAI